MLIIKVNNSRIFFVNEFYIFIPFLLLVEGIIIMIIRRKLKKNKEKGGNKRPELPNNNTGEKLYYLASGNFIQFIFVSILAGSSKLQLVKALNEVDLFYEDCVVNEGASYINDATIRKYIVDNFGQKAKDGVIYISRSALCYLAKNYALEIASPVLRSTLKMLPIQLPWWKLEVGSTFLPLTYIRGVAAFLITSGVPLIFAGPLFGIPSRIVAGSFSILIGVILGKAAQDPTFDILMEAIESNGLTSIKQRIPGIIEVVCLNFNQQTEKLALLPTDQTPTPLYCLDPFAVGIKTSKCGASQFSSTQEFSSTQVGERSNILNIEYGEVVNMEHASKLSNDVVTNGIQFTDRYEIGIPKRILLRRKLFQKLVSSFLKLTLQLIWNHHPK